MLRQAFSRDHTTDMSITGVTKIFAVVGDPVVQVRAPELMNQVFMSNRFDAVMFPVNVTAQDLGQTMHALKSWKNLHGILVTIPHKFAACEYADTLSEVATLAGCANAFRRESDGTWFAENFDGEGFVQGLATSGFELSGKHVMIVGAGGAGASIAAALSRQPVASITITDIDPGRSDSLAQRLAGSTCAVASAAPGNIPNGVQLAINATPLGLSASDPLPFDPKHLGRECLVADVIMKPAVTELLKTASAFGLAIHHGAPMLNAQIDLYTKFFRIRSANGGVKKALAP
ncbi:shikimate dehydrogenase [Mesorhizobium sp. SB112]|uniref:shikimate dehydrogenase family protein n=1 Tax=Mesorhizobium sp. SB112 TaxID=3151853 RepID=UPI0032678E4D